MATEQIRYCGPCAQPRVFYTPPCLDDHGHLVDWCPDLACQQCGHAVTRDGPVGQVGRGEDAFDRATVTPVS